MTFTEPMACVREHEQRACAYGRCFRAEPEINESWRAWYKEQGTRAWQDADCLRSEHDLYGRA